MIFRSPIVRKVTVLAALGILLISLFHYYKYSARLKFKPSEEFLNRVSEARKADSESTQYKVSKLTETTARTFENPEAIPKRGHGNTNSGPPGSLVHNDVVPTPAPRQQAPPQQPAGSILVLQSNGENLVNPQTDSTPLANVPKPSDSKVPDQKGNINAVVDEKTKQQTAVQGDHGKSLGEERAENQYDPVTSNIKTLHSLDKKGDSCVFGRNKLKEKEWLKKDKTTTQKTTKSSRDRADHIKEMMIHAWSNYDKYAWGSNELAPLVKYPHDGIFAGTRMGLTIVDSLDTLWIMGLFDEVEKGKQWLVQNLTIAMNVNVDVSVFEFNIRYVGGLLSMYALTNECEYKQLAMKCADKLVPAFNTTYGIPSSQVNLKYGNLRGRHDEGTAVLAEIGTLHLEFVYLSHITGKPVYKQLVEKLRENIVKANVDGLYGNTINVGNAQFNRYNLVVSVGGMGDSFYEYLFKSFLQSGGKDIQAKEQYFSAMEAIVRAGILKKSYSGLLYFGIMNGYGGKMIYDRMEHLACFIGGLMGLSAEYSGNRTWTLNTAEEIAKTCHESYIRSASKIGPESFVFDMRKEARADGIGGDPSYHLRPETVETWYFLQRVTGKNMYKEWAWEFAQALEKHCKVPNGYAGLVDVNLNNRDGDNNPLQEDIQQSFFLAETLKYLYLIYKDDGLLPISEWVFNTEAHPLPILHYATS